MQRYETDRKVGLFFAKTRKKQYFSMGQRMDERWYYDKNNIGGECPHACFVKYEWIMVGGTSICPEKENK